MVLGYSLDPKTVIYMLFNFVVSGRPDANDEYTTCQGEWVG